MPVPLAWRNLAHNKPRTAVALAGVAFALVLIFMQLGFLNATRISATQLAETLDFDIVMLSNQYLDMNRPRGFPRDRLERARAVPGVAGVASLGVGYGVWRSPDPGPDGRHRLRVIQVIGIDPDEPALFRDERRLTGLREAQPRLRDSQAVLFDRSSRPEFGTVGEGTRADLGPAAVRVAGVVRIGTGFGADGLVLAGPELFRRLAGFDPRERVGVGLVRLEPGADAAAALAALRAAGGGDVRALGRTDFLRQEQLHWVLGTNVGTIFALGVAVAFLVGTVFVYQVMSGDIANRLHEYATLAAMGYPASRVSRVVLAQALTIGALSYAAALGVSAGLFALAAASAGLPMRLEGWIAGGVLAAAAAMCGLSGRIALRQLRRADPADLF